MSKLLRVEVSKKRWYRGKSKGSMLRLAGGKQCCIGFLARKLGAKVRDIQGASTLEYVTNHIPSCFNFSCKFDHVLALAYETNDNEKIKDVERIRELKALGKEMGVQFI